MPDRPPLRVIDSETGEVRHTCESCQELADQVNRLEAEARAHRARLANALREKATEIENDPLYNDVALIVKHWQKACHHPKSRLDLSRFRLVKPFLERHGMKLCLRAVDGAAYDPYVTTRKNGTKKRHDGLELIFKDAAKFEEFCNRAPMPTTEGK